MTTATVDRMSARKNNWTMSCERVELPRRGSRRVWRRELWRARHACRPLVLGWASSERSLCLSTFDWWASYAATERWCQEDTPGSQELQQNVQGLLNYDRCCWRWENYSNVRLKKSTNTESFCRILKLSFFKSTFYIVNLPVFLWQLNDCCSNL